MKKIFVAAAVCAAATSMPAFAQVFSGPVIGAQLSRDAFEVKTEGTDIGGAALSLDGISANGIGGGVYVGYDYAFSDAAFFGVEANLNLSSASASAKVEFEGDSIAAKIQTRESFGASARLGYMIAEGTALYARGGWQSTKFKLSVNGGGEGFTAKDTQDALVYGAGLETRIDAQTSLRVEYLIEDFGSAGLNRDFDINGIRVDNNKLSLGVSYRF